MKAFWYIFLMMIAAFVSGCASQPYRDYDSATSRAAVANMCERKGLVTSEDFAHYSELQMGWGPRQFGSVDSEKMQSLYLEKVAQYKQFEISDESAKERFKMRCAEVTVVASRVKGKNSAPSQSFPTFTPTKTTNCMTTFGLTRCTTN